MTLIVPVTTPTWVAHITDRRLTNRGELVDDDSTKVAFLACRDARMVISYTGLARIGDKLTSQWLASYLSGVKANDMTLSQVLAEFRGPVVDQIRKVARNFTPNDVTFVLSGFESRILDGQLSHRTFSEYVSTRADTSGIATMLYHEALGSITISACGAIGAVTRFIKRRLTKMFRANELRITDATTVADMLVSVVRMTTRTKSTGRYIGRGCTSAIVYPSGDPAIVARYHPFKELPVASTPWYVFPNFAASFIFGQDEPTNQTNESSLGFEFNPDDRFYWCAHCERVSLLALGSWPQCKYIDCSASANRNYLAEACGQKFEIAAKEGFSVREENSGWNWHNLRSKSHPEYPEVPIVGVRYPVPEVKPRLVIMVNKNKMSVDADETDLERLRRLLE